MKISENEGSGDGSAPTWNLCDLFASRDSPQLAEAVTLTARDAQLFAKKYQGKIAQLDGPQLGAAIEAYEKIMEQMARVTAFASLTMAADSAETAWGEALLEHLEPVFRRTLFFSLEINQLEGKTLAAKVSDPLLARYEPWINRIRAYSPYQLENMAEEYIYEKSSVAEAAWTRLFDMTLASMRFKVRGKDLTVAETTRLVTKEKDPEFRREALAELSRVLGQHKKVFALVVNTLADLKSVDDERRGFSSPEASRYLFNQVKPETVNAMMNAVRESHPRLSHRYYTWKAKKFGVTRLHPADCQAPLPGNAPGVTPWAEAKDLVLKAYRKFSPEMADIGQKFFDQSWIDAEPHPGKKIGAFMHPAAPSLHPYILLNYKGTSDDVQTLGHELGRGIHLALAAGQGYLQSAPSLALEKTASVFGDMLVFREMLDREPDPEVRRTMLAGKVENMLNTVVRQAAFFSFEQKVHQERRKKGELPPERLAEIWRETQKEGLGTAVNLDIKAVENLWIYTPQLVHAPFNIPAYGECCGYALYSAYTEAADKEGFVGKFLDLLRAGGTAQQQESLTRFGLDVTDPLFWKKGLSVIEGYVDELVALDQKIEAIQKLQKDFKDTARDIAPSVPPPSSGSRHDPRGPAP